MHYQANWSRSRSSWLFFPRSKRVAAKLLPRPFLSASSGYVQQLHHCFSVRIALSGALGSICSSRACSDKDLQTETSWNHPFKVGSVSSASVEVKQGQIGLRFMLALLQLKGLLKSDRNIYNSITRQRN